MDLCGNVSVPGKLPSEYQQEQPSSKLGCFSHSLDDLLSPPTTEADVSLEWLSIFVEDCLSCTGTCLAAAPPDPKKPCTTPKPSNLPSDQTQQKLVNIPARARSKRKRAAPFTAWAHRRLDQTLHSSGSDPPLLQQAYWLADSELIVPEKKEEGEEEANGGVGAAEREEGGRAVAGGGVGPQGRRCSHCLAQRTPQWRAGPLGPKTLCNACGVRYKSGRLLPEYRPAKSPTFVSYKHSNSHKKVMEMRMGLMPDHQLHPVE